MENIQHIPKEKWGGRKGGERAFPAEVIETETKVGDLFLTEYRRNVRIKQPLQLWSQDYGPGPEMISKQDTTTLLLIFLPQCWAP